MNFQQAFAELLKHEGGFVDHPSDPGGATNFGITQAVARKNGYTGHMKDYPQHEAMRVYRKDYWDVIKADDLPQAVRYPMFDAAVNSGPAQAAKWLQRELGVKDDGVIGPQTINAARAADGEALARKILGTRLHFMTGLQHWPSFSRGWARRIADLLMA